MKYEQHEDYDVISDGNVEMPLEKGKAVELAKAILINYPDVVLTMAEYTLNNIQEDDPEWPRAPTQAEINAELGADIYRAEGEL